MKNAGFSLIELMISIAIIAILVAITMPNYSSYVIKSSRSEAIAVLLHGANQQEQYFSDNYQYSNNLDELNIASSTKNKLYDLTVSRSNNSKSFILKASRSSKAAADPDCVSFAINEIGQTTSSGSATSRSCWNN